MSNIPSSKSVIREWIKTSPCFTTDGKVIFCQVCSKEVSSDKKHRVQQHESTATHQANIKRKQSFYADMCKALVVADIPWRKIENPTFKYFLEKYCGRKVPSESTLRKSYLESQYKQTLHKIGADIGDSYVWIAVDETTDAGRYVAHLIVGKFNRDNFERAYLLTSKPIEKANSENIADFVNTSLKVLYPDGIKDRNVLLMYSNAAPYLIAAGKLLKVFYQNLLHVTCFAHGLRRVAEEIRNKYSNVNKLISSMKKVFCKAPSRVNRFKEALPNTPLPPEPIITRWGTWLDATEYYNTNFDHIKAVIDTFSAEDGSFILSVQEALQDKKKELVFISTNFTFITKSITKLESSGETLNSSVSVVLEVERKLRQATGKIAQAIQTNLSVTLQKNPGYSTIKSIANILEGDIEEEAPTNINISIIPHYKYAPVTTVDVERSFFGYKLVLTTNACSSNRTI